MNKVSSTKYEELKKELLAANRQLKDAKAYLRALYDENQHLKAELKEKSLIIRV